MKTTRFLRMAIISLLLAGGIYLLPASGLAFREAKNAPLLPESVVQLTSLAGEEYDPDLAYSPTHDQFMLTFSYSQPAGEWYVFSIQAVFVDENGNPTGAPVPLSGISGYHRQHPAAAYNNARDEYLVLWDYQSDVDDNDIYRVTVSGSGGVGTETALDSTDFDDSLPDLAYNPVSGGYLAVWERYQTDQSEIYAQKLDAFGSPSSAGFYIADDSIDESGAAVASSATGGNYLVVWHEQTAYGNYDIYGQIVNSAGTPTGSPISISTAAGDQMHPQLAYNDADDQFLVVWQDGRTDGDIYGQRLSAGGSLIGGNFAVAEDGASYRSNPQVAYQPQAVDTMVTWQISLPGENVDVYRRRIRTDGFLPEAEMPVSTLGSLEMVPTIAAGEDISYLLAWQDGRDIAQNENIYGTIVRLNRIQGKVFEGLQGDETLPLEEVTVGLYGSNNFGEQGVLLESMQTVTGGWFGLIAPAGNEYYSIVEINPDGFASEAAYSPGGVVQSNDWIQFEIPLESKDLTGNRFWDLGPEPEGCGGYFYPSADASVALYAPETNFGSGPVQFVEHSEPPGSPVALTYLQFNLDGRIPPEAVIHYAELELTLSMEPLPAADLELGLASLPHEWGETTVTWNNRPALGVNFGPKYYSPIWSNSQPVVLRIDVSTLVTLWATGAVAPTSLALVPGDERLDFNFESRETDHPPRLVVRCSPYVEPLPKSYPELNERQLSGLARLTSNSSVQPTIQLGESGAVRFAMFDITPPSVYTDSLSRADWFTEVYSDVLRLSDPEHDLQFVRRSADDADLFFRQRFMGIPVLGSEINIHFLGDHITGLSGSYLSDLQINANPQIPASRAREIALALGAPGAKVISEDQLRILNRGLFVGDEERSFLTWLVVLDQNGGEELYIDANTGAMRFQQPRSKAGFDLDIETVNHNSGAGTYCHHYWWTTDDDHWCDEGGCDSGTTQEGLDAYNYIKNVYNYWSTYMGRDSFDDDGDDIQIYMNVGTNWTNAHWLGGCDFFEFGDNYATQDIMGHEFSHAVTDYTSELVYSKESGALDESFCDINGAFVDYGDYLIGENLPGGAIRSLQNPPLYGDPDRYNSPLKASLTGGDHGGVHTNSGINNKAAYLATEGGTFNNVTVPSGGISVWRARVLFYKTLKRLTSNASMLDARNAAVAAAKEMAQQGTNGFTSDHLCYVRNAYHAVELGDGDLDCDGTEDNWDPDQDGDKVTNSLDNCPQVSNPDQKNTDKDSQGDACDTDDDNDGDLDSADNCPLVQNANQTDTDQDGEGDACDDNDDGDLLPDSSDNCPLVSNWDQMDSDGDGNGDACDLDDDNDYVSDSYDNCPLVKNPNQANNDGDLFGDACDLCPGFYGTDNGDPDKDGKGNSCDDDDDNDGVLDGLDNCPVDYNPEQHDIDGDGNGWACDQDDADILLQQLKMLTLQYNRDSPIRFPLPGCATCGGGYIDPAFREQISLVSKVGFYAQIVDSSGKVLDRSKFGGSPQLSQTLNFAPAPYANPNLWELPGKPETFVLGLPPDGVRYYLELFPTEDLDLGQTYTMTVTVDEVMRQEIFLPIVRR